MTYADEVNAAVSNGRMKNAHCCGTAVPWDFSIQVIQPIDPNVDKWCHQNRPKESKGSRRWRYDTWCFFSLCEIASNPKVSFQSHRPTERYATASGVSHRFSSRLVRTADSRGLVCFLMLICYIAMAHHKFLQENHQFILWFDSSYHAFGVFFRCWFTLCHTGAF